MKSSILSRLLAASSVLLGLFSAQASAALIEYSTRAINQGVNNSDYMASYNNQTSVETVTNLAAFTNISGGNTFSRLKIDFTVGGAFSANTFAFQLAPDAGFGGALYLDGVLMDIDASDLWWGLNWNNITEFLVANNLNSFQGTHQILAFWAEGCCAGPQSGRFSTDGGATYQALSVANLDALNVPEPGTMAIVGLGLAGVALSRRRRATA